MWVVLCRNKDEAKTALSLIESWVFENGLELSPEKTHIGSSLQPGHGFEFLGYRFENGCRYVRSKSLKKFKDKIRLKTRRSRGDSIEHIVSDLNPTIRGWFGYFKHAHNYTFSSLDGFIRRRLRAVLRKHQKRPSSGRTGKDHRLWPNAFFAERGLFTMREAHLLARQSRWGNHQLESRVRENRTHGSEGGEGRPFPTPILIICNRSIFKVSSGYRKTKNPTSQFEKQGLGILSIITFHRLLLDHRLNAHPQRLSAYMQALAFWSAFWSRRCCRQMQIKWLIRSKIFFSSLFSLLFFVFLWNWASRRALLTINIWNRPLLSIVKSSDDKLRVSRIR